MKHHDPLGDIRRLRTFAALLQRRAEVAVETHGWNSDHGIYKLTLSADNLIFWRTYNEIHTDQVGRDGEARMRTQGRRR